MCLKDGVHSAWTVDACEMSDMHAYQPLCMCAREVTNVSVGNGKGVLAPGRRFKIARGSIRVGVDDGVRRFHKRRCLVFGFVSSAL